MRYNLKVMPKITNLHVNLNNLKKMKVNFAFHLFSEVLRGLFFNKHQIGQVCSYSEQTEKFVYLIHKLILVMISRAPSDVLKPDSKRSPDVKGHLGICEQMGSMHWVIERRFYLVWHNTEATCQLGGNVGAFDVLHKAGWLQVHPNLSPESRPA